MGRNQPEIAPQQVQQDLLLERLAAGDQNSVVALGIAGAEALKIWGVVTFAVDALGRVQILPAKAVQIAPGTLRLKDEDLDTLEEESAIQALLMQGEGEAGITDYLHRRSRKVGY